MTFPLENIDGKLYFLKIKILFAESVLSYNIPQGMVRGATLELLDISYDGVEDPNTGYLTGGLGQLVDGKYGAENYRAMGENGVVRGENGWFSSFQFTTHFLLTWKQFEKFGAKFELLIIFFSPFPGYEWVGWKNKSMGPLQMDFTFVNIRKFDSVCIHINNHYSKDIQIFSRAKEHISL